MAFRFVCTILFISWVEKSLFFLVGELCYSSMFCNVRIVEAFVSSPFTESL